MQIETKMITKNSGKHKALLPLVLHGFSDPFLFSIYFSLSFLPFLLSLQEEKEGIGARDDRALVK